MGCVKCPPPRLDAARWQEAQDAERTYWYARNAREQAARRDEEAQRAQWVASFLLGITSESVAGKSVLDIGGGPQPIVAWSSLPLARRIMVEPMPLGADDLERLTAAGVEIVRQPAEDYVGPQVDEAWGYNVLQHVMSPALVLETAMRQARVVRWFEWVHQPTSVVHPHVITPETFDALAGWTRVSWHQGTRDEGRGWAQQYVAGVWERP